MSSPSPEASIPSTPPAPDHAQLQPPTALTSRATITPRESFTPSAAPLVPETEKSLEENKVEGQPERRRSLFRRPLFWLAVAAAVVVIVLAVVLPVYFTVIKPKNNTSTNNGSSNGNPTNNGGNNNTTPNNPKGLITGGDGSTVTTDNGTEFTYHNPFGGYCASASLFSTSNRVISQFNRRGLGSGKPVQ